MNMREHLIESLRRLCDHNGGYKAVADRAQVDDQSLYQILSGVKLPSGNPKGVGPTIQRKLDVAFPGWADSTAVEAAHVARELGRAYNADWPFTNVSRAALQALNRAQRTALEHIMLAYLGQPRTAPDWRTVALGVLRNTPPGEGYDTLAAFVARVDSAAASIANDAEQPNPTPAGV